MSVVETRVRRQLYLDSVALMRMSGELAGGEGVEDAAMMMATPANREILAAAGLVDGALPDDLSPGDLVVAVRATGAESAAAAIARAEALLERPRGGAGGEAEAYRPRTLAGALDALPDASLALISVPGPYAAAEARRAIRRGLDAMVFSDNVPVEDERALKEEAHALGRLVMGPDCGTAVIAGVPLAFANALPRGPVGIVGASGTGIQEIACLLARAGVGVSHAIGVGGRDLADAVGGLSTLAALDLLERDAATERVVVVSKPPAPAVAARVLERIAASAKPFTLCFLGGERPDLPDNARWAETLRAAARNAAGDAAAASASTVFSSEDDAGAPDGTDSIATAFRAEAGEDAAVDTDARGAARSPSPPSPGPLTKGRLLRGLYSGGTLCAEAQLVLRRAGLACTSNAPIPGAGGALDADGHTLVDLGADEHTRGRPHPMIEPAVRDAALTEALADSRTGVVLVDLVIGFGAHADPAGHLVASLPATRRAPIVASVTGTEDDPQVRSRQVARLREAGIAVAPSNAAAAELAATRLAGER